MGSLRHSPRGAAFVDLKISTLLELNAIVRIFCCQIDSNIRASGIDLVVMIFLFFSAVDLHKPTVVKEYETNLERKANMFTNGDFFFCFFF